MQINAGNSDRQNKCSDDCELFPFFTPPIAKNCQCAENWENKVKALYSCKKCSLNWVISSCVQFIKFIDLSLKKYLNLSCISEIS